MEILEELKNKNIYCVFDNDLDGNGCRVLAEYFIKPISKSINITATSDRSMNEFDWDLCNESDYILFGDITPCSLEMYNKILSLGKKVIIADHHITANNVLGQLENYYFDTSLCATKILFNLILNKKRRNLIIQDFVDLVNIYDLYLTTDTNWNRAKGLNAILYGSINWAIKYKNDFDRYTKFCNTILYKLKNYPSKYFYFSAYEKQLIQKEEKKELNNYKVAKKNLQIRTDNSGNTYGYTECSSKISLVSKRILTEYKDKIKYLIIYGTYLEVVKKQFTGKISLRSNSDFDVSIIAEKHKGGGHPQSSGIVLDYDLFNKIRSGDHLI